MADEKKEPWLNYLALTTVVFAVCATLSTLKGGGFSTRSVMSQSQASDQWSYYQSKSIKGYIYDLQREKLELELKTLKAGGVRSASGEYEKKITAYKEKVERYEKEKEEIKQKAEDLEKKRDAAQRHSAAFGMATMFLQIAILLSSIAALMKQKYFWFLGIAGGCIGLLYFFNGFFLFMN
jgi:DNA repair exonuclease SbcCD ATPase subunit